MIKAPIRLQDLRRKIYRKAKSEKTWRFWGLYVHVTKMETLRAAYKLAKSNEGAPGIDGVTFEAVEKAGLEKFLQQLREQMVTGTYYPRRNRKKEIPKGNGKVRVLGIPTIRDRVVQGALKLILEPIFEAGFQEGSFGYRPKRTAHEALQRVSIAIVQGKTRVIDVDLKSYFDTVRHDILLKKVAERIDDDEVMHLLKLILKANGKMGVPQGGVISPLLSNLYLNELDKMLEKAKAVTATCEGRITHVEYARFADDLVILVDGEMKWDWLVKRVCKRVIEEFSKLKVEINREKTRIVDLKQRAKFGFLGFDIRRVRTLQGKWGAIKTPKMKARNSLCEKMREVFRHQKSQPVDGVIREINPILRGWVNYFRVGNSSHCFNYVKEWIERKIRRHMMRARKRPGFGWDRWSSEMLYRDLGLYGDYRIRYYRSNRMKALPVDRNHNPLGEVNRKA
jgi:RNA-directed DNA polymerase